MAVESTSAKNFKAFKPVFYVKEKLLLVVLRQAPLLQTTTSKSLFTRLIVFQIIEVCHVRQNIEQNPCKLKTSTKLKAEKVTK